MKSRTALPAFAVCAVCVVLAPLSGCGDGGTGPEPSPADGVPSAPAESREPTPGKGSKDPDDINGDGYRDLMVPVPVGERVAVVHGSAKGLDPSIRTVYSRRDLGLPDPPEEVAPGNPVAPDTVADLDGDGFPDFVTSVMGEIVEDRNISAARTAPYVTWGGPDGPTEGAEATPVRLPQSASKLGLESVVRGDFDGDGHHDLAASAKNGSSLVVLYGPFTRSGAPARTDTGLPASDGSLVADDIDPSGKPRATSLLFHADGDGEQSGNTLYPARPGTGLSANAKQLRPGNARAFGDFDGDGVRDVAIGDSGGRNDEPGYETEGPEVGGSLAVYPGSGGAPVTYRLPKAPEGATTDYGPGGYVAADPDGDGRDGILVATYEGATLIDGDKRIPVLREGPAKANGKKTPAKWRHARPAGAADFNNDGKDELILHWATGVLFGLYGQNPTHWWITDGTTSRDQATFTTTGFAPRGS
ncbi:FG-GAP repeat domain-containing protein [Streptomyces sp. 2A115]|uniref:FG-GAP repeat domain-containing protein n=1 Tax=Streptomyces sp. 2A115 TaxID=3457439 RepID=UPI003FD28B8E